MGPKGGVSKLFQLPLPVYQPQPLTPSQCTEPTHQAGHDEGIHNPILRRQKQEDSQFKVCVGNFSSESKYLPLITSLGLIQLSGSVTVASHSCFPQGITARSSKDRQEPDMHPDILVSPSSVAPLCT